MTHTLRPMQAWFQLATTHARGLRAGLHAASQLYGFAAESELETLLTAGPRLSAFERLAIYQQGYRARLVECLADDYPALKYALGNEAFETLAQSYIAEHPSESATLNAYGRHMATFCLRAELEAGAFFAELARLEWALVEAVHAELSPALALEDLEGLSSDRFSNARLVPSATLRLLCFDYPVNDYYAAFRQGLAVEVPEPSPSAVVVYRRELTLWRHDLSPPAALLLAALVANETLAAALAKLEALPDLAAADVMSWFRSWIADGLFSAIVTE